MESILATFDSDSQLEPSLEGKGKGIRSFLYNLLYDRVRGEAAIYYEIIKTPVNEINNFLERLDQSKNIKKILEWYDFYTLYFVLSVKMDNPNKWDLNWARFIFDIFGDNISVLSFNPDTQGVKALIEKNGSRDFNISLSAEIGPSAELKLSDTDRNIETDFSAGAKITPKIEIDRKRGWAVKFEDTIEEVKGVVTRKNMGISLEWDIYKNKAVEVPDTNIGTTAVVYSGGLISTTKRSIAKAQAHVSGEAFQRHAYFGRRGSIVLNSIGEFEIKPSFVVNI